MHNELSTDFEFIVATRYNDLGSSIRYNIEHHRLIETDFGKVFYTSSLFLGFLSLFRINKTRGVDFIYFNSFFSVFATFIPMLFARFYGKQKIILLAPRGEFSPGALSLKPVKKKFYILIWKLFRLHDSILWHASNELEKSHILNIFSTVESKLYIASDTIDVVNINTPLSVTKYTPNDTGIYRLVFVSRICRKKNLDYALQILSQCKGNIIFDIYGPLEDMNYWHTCEDAISNLPANIECHYKGAIPSEKVVETFAGYDAFIFPTKGENFGHVILEALNAGTMVIVSDQTPWTSTEKQEIINLNLEDQEKWVNVIRSLLSETVGQKLKRRSEVSQFAERYISADKNRKSSLAMFKEIEREYNV